LLRFVPGRKARDLRNWLTVYGYWNQGGRENVEEAFAYVVQEYLTDITASGRGLHSFTSRLNLSAFHGIGVRVGVV
jgi:cobalamin biosynthesis Mg chelatase CobN